jgi:hypothetical protein
MTTTQKEQPKMNTEQLTWEFKGRDQSADGARWNADTEKWGYEITADIDEEGAASFNAYRYSTNDGMHGGDLETNCATLQEAKAIVEKCHAERYGDNEAEFIEYGGNTADAEEAERKEWTGKFKCRDCGEPITDTTIIQGILHHDGPQQCDSCQDAEKWKTMNNQTTRRKRRPATP